MRRIVEPVLRGEGAEVSLQSDDARYVVDLGLLRTDRGTWEAANPIYREVMARTLPFDQRPAMLESAPSMALGPTVVPGPSGRPKRGEKARTTTIKVEWVKNPDLWWELRERLSLGDEVFSRHFSGGRPIEERWSPKAGPPQWYW